MIALDGCRTEPLGDYLQGLGAWRAVVRLGDPDARAHWQGGRLVLTTRLDAAELVEVLRERFEPLPVVSPWNAGSGFAGNGKNVEAERALAAVRASGDPRFGPLREAVLAADRVVARARANGWGGKGEELWDKARKVNVLRLCRNELPDGAVVWLDAAVALVSDASGAEEPTYSRLLGTGGNFGRLDVQSIYIQRALAVLADPKLSGNSAGWLRGVLYGEEGTPYLRDAVGQFDPGRAGGIQSSPAEKADDKGFANPWAFLLTIEGALLFASAATRRQGAAGSGAAIPFVVRVSPVGFGSAAVEESATAEIWTPEWDRPATLAEIEHLLGEGRVRWGDRPARSGLDFVRAVATLGVDRGISRFTRSVFAERHGQSPLAVPVGVVSVTERGGAGLLARLDPWLEGLRRLSPLPQAVRTGLRALDTALYAAAAEGGPVVFRRVVVALGVLHQAVTRSGRTVERTRPLGRLDGAAWWPVIRPAYQGERGAAELRVAAALAGGRDSRPDWLLRALLTPAAGKASVAAGGSMIDAVAAAHRARAVPGQVPDPRAASSNAGWPDPAVRGVYSAFTRGPRTSLADVVELLTGMVFDEELFAGYLRGLLLIDLSTVDEPLAAGVPLPVVVPPALSLLVPFYATRPLLLQLAPDLAPKPVLLRPGADWLPRLHAGDIRGVAEDAVARLRAAGVRSLIDPSWAGVGVDPDRLAAALLIPIAPGQRTAALRRVATLLSTSDSHAVPEPQGAPA